MRKSTRLAFLLGAVILVIDSLRLLYDVPSSDEPYYTVCALFTSIGGRPFVNELSFQQTSFLLYEPIVAIYHKFFGTFGIYLFVRQLYFVCNVAVAFGIYRYAKRRTGEIAAVFTALIGIFSLSIMLGTLSYNTIGPFGLTAYALLFIEAVRRQSGRHAMAAGLFAAISIAAYPTMVIAVTLHGIFVCGLNLRLKRPSIKLLMITAASCVVPLSLYLGSLVLRFEWKNIYLSYLYTTGISAMGSATWKFAYSWFLFSGYIPWLWLTGSILAFWFYLWIKKNVSIVYALVFFGIFIASGVKDRPENGDWLHSFVLLSALCGLPIVISFARRSLEGDWTEIALWMTGMATAAVTCWTSGQTLYSTNYGSALALIATLVLAFSRGSSKLAKVGLVCVLSVFLFKRFGPLLYKGTTIFERTEMISWGPLAGFLTTARQYDYYKTLQKDVDEASRGAKTIIFYDEMAAGYLMTDLKPMTIAVISHMINQSYPVRHWQRQFHSVPENRPDVVVRFEKQAVVDPPYFWNVNPSQFYPAQDVFWHYLPEESGDYVLFAQNEYYSVYRKKGL